MANKDIFKRILVPFDGSRYSRNALLQAIEISKNSGSKIFIVTAVDASDFPPGMLLALLKKDKRLEQSVSEFVTVAKSQIRRQLLAEVAVCKAKGADAYYDIIAGNPTDAILKFARGRKIDLIVMGSQGLHGIGRLKALGSVSRKISELASCPVMIVH
ncbi:MAG TPA: universal stress protein [Nitrosopumilaceae archaeon]|nr:universal stress protein [Nitrosopumilaceae archaeon]